MIYLKARFLKIGLFIINYLIDFILLLNVNLRTISYSGKENLIFFGFVECQTVKR